MKFYTTKPGEYPNLNRENVKDEYFGNGWSVKAFENKFILIYISGSLQGQLKSIEISEEDFNLAKEGKMSLDDFCIKYDVN